MSENEEGQDKITLNSNNKPRSVCHERQRAYGKKSVFVKGKGKVFAKNLSVSVIYDLFLENVRPYVPKKKNNRRSGILIW